MSGIKFWKNWLKRFSGAWTNVLRGGSEDEGFGMPRREKITVFGIAYLIALVLWLLVNLGRSFNLTIQVPLVVGQLPPQKALSSPLPSSVAVNFTGEGWKLISLYNNPPPVTINLETGNFNLLEAVRTRMNTFSGVSVLKVQPSTIGIDLEKKVSKKMQVIPNVDVSTVGQFGIVGKPKLIPDSVVVTGAKSVVDKLDSWMMEKREIKGVKQDVDIEVPLQKPISIISLNVSSVRYTAKIDEFTEGQLKVMLQTKGLPPGRGVSYNPPAITIKYNIPISEYAQAQDLMPFTAYVSYNDIVRDSTGFVTPVVEEKPSNLHITLTSTDPVKVAYYLVLSKGKRLP